MSDDKPESKQQTSWWQTLPGVLTGVAALLTAVGGLIAALYQNGVLHPSNLPTSSPSPSVSSPANVNPKPDTAQSPSPSTASTSNSSEQVQAGHYGFKLLETKTEPYPGGTPAKVLLRCQLRVTDLMGSSDYVDSQTIRLLVEGAELLPENSINTAIYDRQSQQIEAVFIIPADVNQVVLLVGRQKNEVAQIPIDLKAKAL